MARPRKRRNRNHRQGPYPGATHDAQHTPAVPVSVQEAPGLTTGPARGIDCPLCAGHHEIEKCKVPIRWHWMASDQTDLVFQGGKQRKDLNNLIRSSTSRCLEQPVETLDIMCVTPSSTDVNAAFTFFQLYTPITVYREQYVHSECSKWYVAGGDGYKRAGQAQAGIGQETKVGAPPPSEGPCVEGGLFCTRPLQAVSDSPCTWSPANEWPMSCLR
jgi:hypothetical protein